MDRRTFLTALTSGLLAAPLAAEAQQKVWRIGVLDNENCARRAWLVSASGWATA